MPLLKFNFPANLSPPDSYRWHSPTGYVVKADDRHEWFRAIRKFADNNSIELPENWQAEAEDRLCRVLPPGWSKYEDGSTPKTFLNARFEAGDLARGTEVLVRIGAAPDPLVDQQTAEERARICAACPANVRVSGCYSCQPIADYVARVKGARKTQAESVLNGCAVCRCSLRAAVWIKDEISSHGITPAMHDQFQTLPWCWKREIPPLA